MAALSAPRLTGGAIVSVVSAWRAHRGVPDAATGSRPPSPPVYRVQLFAAPPGERAAGVVQPAPQTPPVETPPPPTKTSTPRPKVPSTQAQGAATAESRDGDRAAQGPVETEAATPEPTAGGGATGGKGADVANIDTNGLEFPYPWYTTNVVSQILAAVSRIERAIHRRGAVRDPARRNGRSGQYQVCDQVGELSV